MHTHTTDPYEVVRPYPCLLATPDGLQHGLVVGRRGEDELVVHGPRGYDRVSWSPSSEAWVLGPADWTPWSTAAASNA